MNKYQFVLAILAFMFPDILNGLSLVIVVAKGKTSFTLKYKGKNFK